MNVIDNIFPEEVIVWAAVGKLKGNIVGYNNKFVWFGRVTESLDVGIISKGVVRNKRSFPVAGRFQVIRL